MNSQSTSMAGWMIGIDAGGTFTDLIAVDRATGQLLLSKVPSTPEDPSVAVANALEQLLGESIAAQQVGLLVHGTTVATNAIIEGAGARTGLLITGGYRGVYEARGWSQPHGSDLVDVFYRKPAMLVPQWLTEEIGERLDYRGAVLKPLDEAEVRQAARRLKTKGVEAVALCFLFSFLNPDHERHAARIVAEELPDCRVSLSSDILPVIREYLRLSTTVIDAYVGPKVQKYLVRLEARLRELGIATPQLFLMQSSGGLMRISIGARHPNQTLFSGPAAGVIAAMQLARDEKASNLITFDMGGTSTDLCVVADGRAQETTEGQIAGQDIGTPMLQIRTLGAGGGTLAWIGKDGLIKVGPKSAGAVPGPACYGRGGDEPTITDANLMLGALGEAPLAGKLKLDRKLAEAAIAKVAMPLGLDIIEAAAGIVRIVNTHMAVALRLALQEQGQDPRTFSLVAFGGAGPIHASYIARATKIPTILVPLYPGVNCAVGLVQTSIRHSYLRSAVGLMTAFPVEHINQIFSELEKLALSEAAEEGFSSEVVTVTRLLDLRYPHQGYSLGISCPTHSFREGDKHKTKRQFDQLHQKIYGQSAPAEDAEIVTFRVQTEIQVPQLRLPLLKPGNTDPAAAWTGKRQLYDVDASQSVSANTYDRARLHAGDRIVGPSVIDQLDATTVILDDQQAVIDPFGTCIITRKGV